MKYRIYYGDDSTYGGAGDSPFDAPPTNVQAVVKEAFTPDGKPRIQFGTDYYYWNPTDGWIGCDWGGLFDYLMMYRGPKAVLFGRTLRDETFYRILSRARAELLG